MGVTFNYADCHHTPYLGCLPGGRSRLGLMKALEILEGNATAELGVLVDRKRAGSGSCASCQRCCMAPLSCPCPLCLVCCSRAVPSAPPAALRCAGGAGSACAAVQSLAQPWQLGWQLPPAQGSLCWSSGRALATLAQSGSAGWAQGADQACPHPFPPPPVPALPSLP